MRDVRGMPQWHPKMNKDQKSRSGGQPSCLNPWHGTRKMLSQFLEITTSQSVYRIPMPLVLVIVLFMYVHSGLACVQLVEKLKGGESSSFLYFPG